MTDMLTGLMWSTTHPDWQRDYYSKLLLETLRTKSLMVPFCAVKADYDAADSGVIVYTEVYDTDPDYNPLTEQSIWLRGAHLDSRTVNIQLEIHGDMLKFSDYNEVVQYIKAGNIRGLVKEKIGQNQVDYLDILARNAFLQHPNKTYQGATSRATLASDDLFVPDTAELIRTHLEENEIPGVQNPSDQAGQTIVCVTTPRVIHDIRVGAGSNWLEVQEYEQTGRKFTNEAGMWGGVRFVRTNRLRLRNHGATTTQTTLDGATVVGQGSALTVDSVYAPGQTGSTRNVPVADTTGFEVGQYVTIHAQGLGTTPLETDGTQETRRIVNITNPGASGELVFDKPLLKPHSSGDYVTNGLDVHASIFIGGPGVVYGVAEAPWVLEPPKYDDLMMINRIGWRGFLKFQMFRPEYFEVVESAGSTN